MKFARLSMNYPELLLSGRKKGLWGGAILLAAFFSGSALTSPIQNRTLEIQGRALATADLVELVGVWPYGACKASAIDAARKIAVIGNGETLQVLDISTPSSPSKIGEVRLEGTPQDIVLAGNYAYLVTVSYFVVVDLSNPAAPLEVWSAFFDETNFRSIAVLSNRLCLASDRGMWIYGLSDPRYPVYQDRYSPSGNGVIDVALWRNYAYCILDYWEPPKFESLYGVEVVDLSLPAAPRLTGILRLEEDCVPLEIEASSDGYAYVSQNNRYTRTEGELIVIDVATDPGHLSEVGRYVKSDRTFGGIAVAGIYVFLFQSVPCHLVTLNMANPRSPVYLGECECGCQYEDITSAGNLVGMCHLGGGFSLYSVAAPASPSRLSGYDTPDTLGNAMGIVARGDYVYLASCSDGLRTMDVSDPSNPREAAVCNNKRQWGGLVVSGKYAYSVDFDRFSIFDISSPRSPSRVADLELPAFDPPCDFYDRVGIAVGPPYAYVSGMKWSGNDRRTGVTAIDISDPSAPRVVSSYICAHKAIHLGSLALRGNYLYLAVTDYSQGDDDCRFSLRVIDVSDPRNLREIYVGLSNITGSGSAHVVVRGNYAYATGNMLRIFDLSNPASPNLLVSYVLRCDGIGLSGDYVYLNWDRLWVIDISNIYYPTGVFCRGEWGRGVGVSGNIASVPGSLSVFRNKMAPDVAITSPSELSKLLGTVPIEVQAAHSSGIERVEFYVDETLKASDTTAPYSYAWDTRSSEDGLHKIRVRVYNKNGKSADVEREVFTRLVYAPLDFKGEKVLNRSLAQAEYINVISWRAHPDNVNIANYRLYQVEGKNQSLLVELNGDTFQYWHRRVERDKSYTYALIAVNNDSRESDPISVTVR